MKSSLLIVVLCWCLCQANAQLASNTLAVVQFYGRITDRSLSDSSEKPLDSTRVEVWVQDSLISTVFSDSKGKYRIILPHHHRYMLKYGSEEYIQKVIELDASEFSEERTSSKLTINIDVALFKVENKSDFDFLKKNPLARGYYRKKDNQIMWDKDYISMMTLLVNNAIYHSEK